MIYKSNFPSKEKLPVHIRELHLASMRLDVPFKTLLKLTETCSTITDRKFKQIANEKAIIKSDKHFILFEDSTFVLFNTSLDWKVIASLYILKTSPEIWGEFLKFVERQNLDDMFFDATLKKMDDIYNEASYKFRSQKTVFRVFDYSELALKLREAGIKFEKKSDKYLILKFSDVEIADVKYNEIIVILELPSFKIERFLLYFNNFYYNSLWGIPIKLHPNLIAGFPYFRNDILNYVDHNNYDMVVYAIKDLVLAQDMQNQAPVIKNNLRQLGLIWGESPAFPSKEKSMWIMERFVEVNNAQQLLISDAEQNIVDF